MFWINTLWLITSYLLGSIAFGVVIGERFYHKDIRNYGSHNIGSTNAFRVLGKSGGSIVFLFDMLKGALPVWIAMSLQLSWHPLFFGGAAVLGHVFPIFFKFKGGKAIATSFGMALAYHPLLALSAISVFFVVLLIWRMVSLSSMIAVTSAVIMSFLFPGVDNVFRVIVILIAILTIIRHKENISRLLNGTESKVPLPFSKRKK